MRLSALLTLFSLPALVFAADASFSSSFTTSVGTVSGGATTTIVTGISVLVTASPNGNGNGNSSASASGSGSGSGGGNVTSAPQSSKPSSTVTPTTLPTAGTSGVDGGGTAFDGGAPSPGATAPGGIFGPPDSHISGARALGYSAVVLAGAGLAGAAAVFA